MPSTDPTRRHTARRRAPRSAALPAAVIVALSACSSGGDDPLALPGASNAPVPTAVPTTVTTTTVTIAPTTAPPTTAPPTTQAPTTTAAATTTTTGPTTTLPAPDGPYYRAGDEGPEISVIQLKLQTVGFLDAGYTDGVFDSATNQAVLDFQGQYGLIVDGVVGPETDRALTAAALSVQAES